MTKTSEPHVWVIEEESSAYPGTWTAMAECNFELKSLRRVLAWWKLKHPKIKFRIRKYVREKCDV